MIKFLDLKEVNVRYHEEFKKQFDVFLNSGTYILGNQVELFESEFASYCGTQFCIGVSSGLDALQLIFEAYKVMGLLQNGDEVIVPANTYIASVLAISNSGLKPVLVEPDIETYNISPDHILKFITSKTKVVLGVHLYGCLYNVKALEQIVKDFNLILLEDAAQAHGAVFEDGRKAGNVSDAAAFSFYPTKNLGALGDAGAITTNDNVLANLLVKLRNYGRIEIYENDIKGFNCRLDELQAAFLRIKLKYLDEDNIKRREIAGTYLNKIKNKSVVLPKFESDFGHVFHQFVIRCKKRDKLKSYLLENGIETLIHYPIAIHKQSAYSELSNINLPVSEQIHSEVLSLPINPSLKEEEVEEIVKKLNSF
ncbi:DegT/DnrJ/EryC1/StrS family aminotransferase [Aestuariibaculum suncheonense]|uniref:DegT/DnrJ/EryC1/StrS family aminotransferase n=1 Tax=Aestuariibaculum suncheonense TaxID=1028745 RepID=A0A8J6QEY2_9FLAO|nr:DegT/DnrJ/EryC1/StrS family aminotransferase [Aestuariibaculum suncheonense]MBD0834501.1 DegT/DnrJ/EryC1/StrS family aminotransferase [Aestuariibaculum suncheonense]